MSEPSAVRVRWFDAPEDNTTLDLPTQQNVEVLNHFFSETVVRDGKAMSFVAGTMAGNPNIAPILDVRAAMNGWAVETSAV